MSVYELCDVSSQIEDLSQQAQMAAAEKFKAPEPVDAMRDTPRMAAQPIQEESDEEEVRRKGEGGQPIQDEGGGGQSIQEEVRGRGGGGRT